MTTTKPNRLPGRGPFRPEHLRSGDPYELSNGHPIECLPRGARNSRANLVGGIALATDPAVDAAGVDTGYATDEQTLPAPDLAVGQVPDTPGWVTGAPPLAVEYADTGQDEADLKVKIGQLFGAGTRFVWVVRLVGSPCGWTAPWTAPRLTTSWRPPDRRSADCRSIPVRRAAGTRTRKAGRAPRSSECPGRLGWGWLVDALR